MGLAFPDREPEQDCAWVQDGTDAGLPGARHVFIKVSCLSPSRPGRAPDTRLRHTGSSQCCTSGRDPWNHPCHPVLPFQHGLRPAQGKGETTWPPVGCVLWPLSHCTPSSQGMFTCCQSGKCGMGGLGPADAVRPGLDLERQALMLDVYVLASTNLHGAPKDRRERLPVCLAMSGSVRRHWAPEETMRAHSCTYLWQGPALSSRGSQRQPLCLPGFGTDSNPQDDGIHLPRPQDTAGQPCWDIH